MKTLTRRLFLLFPALAMAFPRTAKAVDVGVIIRMTGSNVLMPQFSIGCVLKNSKTGELIYDSRDGTGKNLLFPNCLTDLTQAERTQFAEHVGKWFLERYMGQYRD